MIFRLKKHILLLLTSILLLQPTSIFANISNEIIVKIDGKTQTYDQPPTIINGSVMVPLRGIFEALDSTLTLDGKDIEAKRGDIVVNLTIGSDTALVNGKTVKLSQKSQVINGRTLVPLRFVSEALGASVNYDGSKRIVTVESSESTSETEVTFANCAAAREAGKAPLHKGDPGYSTKLDRDGDGIACE
ncbi:stalk domain-containing protein [Paenibacillus alkalitolerans]|uniref:stalk domain-containing protein n=1 Tax=Paenibacillus alkalitolerans TaxID=2799335 RepID=UPI0018F766D2|nr:stalk domain-containing protein [Paenibacillus alkalitolerans]